MNFGCALGEQAATCAGQYPVRCNDCRSNEATAAPASDQNRLSIHFCTCTNHGRREQAGTLLTAQCVVRTLSPLSREPADTNMVRALACVDVDYFLNTAAESFLMKSQLRPDDDWRAGFECL